jgi:hypothetical protein
MCWEVSSVRNRKYAAWKNTRLCSTFDLLHQHQSLCDCKIPTNVTYRVMPKYPTVFTKWRQQLHKNFPFQCHKNLNSTCLGLNDALLYILRHTRVSMQTGIHTSNCLSYCVNVKQITLTIKKKHDLTIMLYLHYLLRFNGQVLNYVQGLHFYYIKTTKQSKHYQVPGFSRGSLCTPLLEIILNYPVYKFHGIGLHVP